MRTVLLLVAGLLATATRIALRILFQVMMAAYGWKPQPGR